MMADEMLAKQIPLTIIVAATKQNGIGKNGALPWPMIKKEMAYFARVTKRVPIPTNTGSLQSDILKHSILEGTQRNAVIMGRKTWESIPSKFRPLKERTNIVITTQTREQLQNIPDDVIVASNINAGLESLVQLAKQGKLLPLGRAFVIGGTSVYKSALELPQTKHILLTRIHKDYECDTFFPEDLTDDMSPRARWQKQSQDQLSNFIGEQMPVGAISEKSGDEDVEFEYHLYERP
jgi:dihydrofolate reductase